MKGNMTGFVKPLLMILAVVAAVILIAFAAASMMGGDKELGQAIDFTATDAAGNTLTLSKQYDGGVALIFFNRTQSDGKALLTNLAAATEETEVKTLLIAIGEQNGEDITAYLSENGLHADTVIPDPKGEIAALYNVTACPITYFIDEAGTVRGVSLSNLTPSAAAKYVGYIQ